MKFYQFTALLTGLLFAGLLASLMAQRLRLANARDELIKREALLSAAVSAPEPAPPAVPAETSLTDAELRELLTLRRDVGRLRQEKAKLAALQAENARLKATVAEAASSTNRVPVPEGYLVASRAKFTGLATPADTLQSFLWSLSHRDTNALFQVLTPDSAKLFAGENVNRLFGTDPASGPALPGFLIKSVEENADGTAVAELQPHPHHPEFTEHVRLERDEQGSWRLSEL